MRKYLWFCALLAVLFFAYGNGEAGTKKCLGEMFTNTSCGPCKNANQQLDKWTDPNDPAYVPDWIVIRYHTWWPSSSDPFYAANKSENKTRTNYYGVNYVPDMWLGNDHGTSNYNGWKAKAQAQIGEYTPYNVALYGHFDPSTWKLDVQAHVWADGPVSGSDHRIFFVLTQDEVHWNAPNGQTVFYQAMMKMLNGAVGTPISMDEGDYQVFSQSYTLDPGWPHYGNITYNWRNTNIVVFIQSYGSKRVKAVEASKIKDLVPGPALWASRTFISAAAGGSVSFGLEAGTAYAGRTYLLLGGITGTSPGTVLPGGEVLPLNWDLFTNVVIGLVNSPFFANFYGTLDGTGSASAQFDTFGPLDPSVVGLTFSFAYTLMSPFDMVSNPVDVPVNP